MKKILLISLLLTSYCFSSKAQHTYPTTPLYGTTSGTDRTYRDLQLGTTTITDTLGSTIDTVLLIPGFVSGAGAVFQKDYVLNLQDSCVLAISNVGSSYPFSRMTLYINAPALSGKVKFLGYSGFATQWALTSAATSVSPTASHYLIMKFVQIGGAWRQESQSQD